MPLRAAHPYELAFFGVSALAFVLLGVVFVLKVRDLRDVIRQGMNGATLFNAEDKLLRQAVVVVIDTVLLVLSVTSINNKEPLTTQALNLLSGGILIGVLLVAYSLLTFRRRAKLPILVEHELSKEIRLRRRTDVLP